MISRTAIHCQTADWKRELSQAVSDPDELISLLHLPRDLLPSARAAARKFTLRVPRYFVGLMTPGDPGDPLLRQVLPVGDELREAAGFCDDPVGDRQATRNGGILSKYLGRSLLITSGACAINCRYCFRRAFPYSGHLATRNDWQDALAQLRSQPEDSEVILSGGDPLTLDDQRLEPLIQGLDDIPHLRRLRIHTRLPVVLPSRITPGLVRLLERSRLQVVVVLHFNHPRELPPATAEALRPLKTHCTLLNQSVLLRGVNDSADVLTQLSERLFDSAILPYYIHGLDRVKGAAHFDVDPQRASRLLDELRGRLPGYLVPRLVKEEPGKPSKTPIE